ncbi:hypothetical protein V8C42DRAFT_33953 [Trichoderma barbatum]
MSSSKGTDTHPTPAAAGTPQELEIGAKGQVVRKPLASVTKAIENPLLPSLMKDGWEHIQKGGGPATEAGRSQTTDTTATTASATGPPVGGDINDADSGVHNSLSRQNIQAFDAKLGPRGHNTPGASFSSAIYVNEDGMSDASMDASHSEIDKSSYGTANAPRVESEIIHMATWA